MKTLTQEKIKAMSPCPEGWRWLLDHFGENKRISPLVVLNALINDNQLSWANWFIVRVMTKPQYVRYAIFAAEQVIEIYEKKYPDDDRPRKAINAAKAVLKNNTNKTRAAAYTAANAVAYTVYAADAAAYAAYAAANAADAAAYAAYAAANAAYAAYAAYTAYAAYAAAKAAYTAYAAYAAADAMKLKILEYGIKLLKGK